MRAFRRNSLIAVALPLAAAVTCLSAMPSAAAMTGAAAGTGGPGAPAGSGPALVAAAAAQAAASAPSSTSAPSPASPGIAATARRICPPARPGELACQAVYVPGRGGSAPAAAASAAAFAAPAGPSAGYGPADLRAAYGLTGDARTRGRHETVAIVDAYRDPHAASDLARYRSHYHLGACTTASGCLRIVNQAGKRSPLPRANADWAVEESLDLDMVSAICPHCRILLVEANSPTPASLGIAENTAVAMGARFVSNSWSGTEGPGQAATNHYFNHPGAAIVFASGDSGYGTSYPADLQYVTSVGGTSLVHRRSGSRAWTEAAWGSAAAAAEGTGSGCSARTAKPPWQRAPVDIGAGGCANRTENDVAAVADPATGVAVYDTYKTRGTWAVLGGTSAATPIITAVYALAGSPARRSYPASYLYQHPARFHDVTAGADGVCPAASSYLCHGLAGYDGPTGLGTPRGTYGFSRHRIDPVTLVDPGTKRVARGRVRLTITGLDTRAGARLSYTATGLPPGLSVRAARGSTNGIVTGTIAATVAPGTSFHVVITATDRAAHASASTRFVIQVR